MPFISKLVVVCFFIFISGSSWVYAQCLSPNPDVFGESPSCSPKSFTLSAIGSPDSYNWYDAPVGGNLVYQGDFFTTPVLSVTTTYYVAAVDNFTDPTCESDRIPITSAILPNPTNVNVFGNNEWIAYCFNGINWTNYKGLYHDNNLSINTTALWSSAQSPNNGSPLVAGYDGCPVSINNHSISYKRQGFPAGIYRIDVLDHNDDFVLKIDGVVILDRVGHGQSYPGAWIGELGPSTKIEYKWLDITGKSSATVTITAIPNPTDLFAGNLLRNLSYCTDNSVDTLENKQSIVADRAAYVESSIGFTPVPDQLITNAAAPDAIDYSYLSFEVSALKNMTLNNAYLYIHGDDRVSYPNKSVFLKSTDTSWSESGITWANQPAASSLPISSTVVYDISNQWYAFDITSYLQAQINANTKRISFQLSDTTDEDNPLVFFSRHTAFPPKLVINTTRGGCTGYTYQWQHDALCDNTWIDISGATDADYFSPVGLTNTGCYRLQVTDGCLNQVYSDIIRTDVDPAAYGNNQWLAHSFSNTTFSLADYKGFYTDNNLNINTPSLWNPLKSPSAGTAVAASYEGCPVPVDKHSISYKRQGFPAGTYRIDIIDQNDDFTLSIDGVSVLSRASFGQTYSSAWIGKLDANSKMEYRWQDTIGKSSATVNLVSIPNPTDLYAGRIRRDQAYCVTGDPSLLEDSVAIAANQTATVQSFGLFSAAAPGQIATNAFSPNHILYSYLNFDISSVRQSTFNNAFIYLRASARTTFPNKLVFVASSDTSWEEATINWLNKPAASPTPLSSTVVYDTSERWYKFEVSSYIQSQLASNNKRVSFLISDTASVDDPLYFYDRNTPFAPLLVVNNKKGGCSGYTYQWQSSLFCTTSWTDIPGATASTYDPPAGLTDSTCYRLQITDACLNTAVSNSIHVNIDPQTLSGTLAVQEIDLNTGIITLSGNEGNVVRWEVSEDNFMSAPTNISTTTTQLNYTGSASTDLYFRARVKSGACSSLYTDTVKIKKVQEFVLFNSFSPNHDGINDVWKINGIERYPANKVAVVNTMGVAVYEANGYDNETVVWDGTAHGQSLPDGTYYYSVEITDKPLMTGYVIIKR